MKKKLSFILTLTLLFLASCNKDEETNPQSAIQVINETTNANAEITFTSIKIKGKIVPDSDSSIMFRGVCWSTSPNPTINSNNKREETNLFTSIFTDLTANTVYYFRVYAITNNAEVVYSPQQTFSTLSLNNTSWKFTTVYPNQNNAEIYSKVNFNSNNTTVFDEMDYPGQCPGCFITNGTWTQDGNEVTYIWEGSDPDSSTYVYHGVLSGMTMTGSYEHMNEPDGNWSAIPF